MHTPSHPQHIRPIGGEPGWWEAQVLGGEQGWWVGGLQGNGIRFVFSLAALMTTVEYLSLGLT